MAEEKKKEIMVISEETIRDKIYVIRGQKVMLSTDLAAIYGYTVSAFNQQVKNNEAKFAEDFRFQLTKDEWDNLKSKNLISSWGGSRKPPYAYTESGIYMLMTVLRGELATNQSIALIRLFRKMKTYIYDTRDGLIEQDSMVRLTMQNAVDIAEIKDTMATKDDLSKFMSSFMDDHIGKELLFMAGKMVESDVAYSDIYSQAKKKIYIVDNYIGIKTLLLLKDIKKGVKVTVFSDNIGKRLTLEEYNDFQKEYPHIQIVFQYTGNKYHDRFIILDHGTKTQRIYHCGYSSKDSGLKTTAISRMEDVDLYEPMIKDLLKNPVYVLKQAKKP